MRDIIQIVIARNESRNYLHNNDESQFGGQNMPKLHGVGVLVLMPRRVTVISIPINEE